MSFSKEELIKILAKDPNIKTAEDIQNVLKDLFGGNASANAGSRD